MDTKLSQIDFPYRFSIIGAGKVAKSLADKLQELSLLDFVVYRNSNRQMELINFGINSNFITNQLQNVVKSDIIIISVNDNSISEIVDKIKKIINNSTKIKFIFHTSGLISPKILLPLADKGINLFSAHPVQTFFFPSKSLLRNIPWGIETIKTDKSEITRIIELLDGKAFFLPDHLVENRALYHLLCVVSSNFLTTTIEFAKLIGNHLEIEDITFLSELIKTTSDNCIRNLNKADTPLTGPLARKDFQAIEDYLDKINDNAALKDILKYYLLANIDIMKEKGIFDKSEAIKNKNTIQKY